MIITNRRALIFLFISSVGMVSNGLAMNRAGKQQAIMQIYNQIIRLFDIRIAETDTLLNTQDQYDIPVIRPIFGQLARLKDSKKRFIQNFQTGSLQKAIESIYESSERYQTAMIEQLGHQAINTPNEYTSTINTLNTIHARARQLYMDKQSLNLI